MQRIDHFHTAHHTIKIIGIVFNFSWNDYDKAFSLTWLVSMQNYWDKRKRSTTVTSCVNALNNVIQIHFLGRGGGGWMGGEVNKGQGYNKLEYDLPA